MKKRLAALLAGILLVSGIAACQSDDTPEGGADSSTTTTTTTQEAETPETDEPVDTDEQTEEPTDTEEPSEEPSDTDEPEAPQGPDLGGRTFKMAAWYELELEPGDNEQDDQLIERYAQMEEDLNFTWEYVNIPWEDYQRTYITNSMAGDALGDVALVEYTWLYPNLSMNGFLADINLIESLDRSAEKWNQDMFDLSTFDGATYGFDTGRPWPVGMMFWNKTMFEREGLPSIYDDINNDTWTWDKMAEYAKVLTQDTDGDGVTDQWGLSGTTLMATVVFSNDAQVIDMSDAKNPTFDLLSDNAMEAFQFIQDLSTVDQVIEVNPPDSEWDYSKTQFANGNVGMFVGQWWQVDSIREVMLESGEEYGIAYFPKGPKADEFISHSTATNIWTVPEAVEDKETAIQIFDLRTEPLPDEHPDDWRIYFEDRVMDAESVDLIQRLQEDGLTVYDTTSHFSGVVELSYTYNDQILQGTETPQAAISAIADQAQNLIDTAMRNTPDDLVDALAPEE